MQIMRLAHPVPDCDRYISIHLACQAQSYPSKQSHASVIATLSYKKQLVTSDGDAGVLGNIYPEISVSYNFLHMHASGALGSCIDKC